MTTIAYRDGIMVADSQETLGSFKYKGSPKILVLENELVIGVAGDTPKIVEAIRFFSRPDWKEKFDDAPDFKKGFEALLVSEGRPYYCTNNCIPVPIGHPFYAIGSGWQLAMAGMFTGMSAEDAVKFAGEMNIYTNKEVQVVDVKTIQTKKSPKRPRRVVS